MYYTAEMDNIFDDNEMTDAGVPVGELLPIEDCSLTPGDPSPIGRTEDGDLAYVVPKTYDHLRLKRIDAAEMTQMLAEKHGITDPKDIGHQAHPLLFDMLNHAVPRALYGDTGHDQMSWAFVCKKVLRFGKQGLPERFIK